MRSDCPLTPTHASPLTADPYASAIDRVSTSLIYLTASLPYTWGRYASEFGIGCADQCVSVCVCVSIGNFIIPIHLQYIGIIYTQYRYTLWYRTEHKNVRAPNLCVYVVHPFLFFFSLYI